MIWLKKRSVYIPATMVLILALATVALFVFFPTEKIREMVQEQAQEKLGRQVSIGEVKISLQGGFGIQMADFVIHNPEGFAGKPVLSLDALDLKLALRPLFKKEIMVHKLVFEKPVLTMVRQANGNDNFTFVPQEPGTDQKNESSNRASISTTPTLSIASLILNDGLFSFSDATASDPNLQNIQIVDLSVKMSLVSPTSESLLARGTLGIKRILTAGLATMPEFGSEMDFDLSWNTKTSRLEIIEIDAKISDLPLSCSGLLVMENKVPSGQIKIEVSDQPLAKFFSFLPPDLAPATHAKKNSGSASATVNLQLTGNQSAPIHTSGSASVHAVELSVFQSFLPPEQVGTLGGIGNLTLTFEQTPGSLAYDGTINLQDVSYTNSGLVDDLQSLDLTMKFGPDLFDIEKCNAKFASGTMALTGSIRDPFPYFLPPEFQGEKPVTIPHLSFNLHSPLLDVDQLIPVASPSPSPGKKKKNSTSNGQTTLLEFPDFTCNGTFSADSLIYMQVPYLDITGQVDIRDRILNVLGIHGSVYSGMIEGQATIDLNNMANPTYTGQYQASNIEVNSFLTRFSPWMGTVFGECNLSGGFSARGMDPAAILNSLTLESDASIREGKVATSGNLHEALNQLANLGNQPLDAEQILGNLATHISVKNGRVGLEDLNTQLGQFGVLSVNGSYGLQGDLDFKGNISLTENFTNSIFNSGGLLSEFSNLLGSKRPQQLELPLFVGGTLSNPAVKLDLKTVSQDLQDKVVQEQGQNLKEEAQSHLNRLLDKWK